MLIEINFTQIHEMDDFFHLKIIQECKIPYVCSFTAVADAFLRRRRNNE